MFFIDGSGALNRGSGSETGRDDLAVSWLETLVFVVRLKRSRLRGRSTALLRAEEEAVGLSHLTQTQRKSSID